MVVQHNLSAMNANRMLGITQGTLSKSTEKLSSGYKVNRAADDAAGLSISEKMRKQIRGLTQASLNAEDGISAVQTAEGALTEVHDMLQRMNELAVKASNGTNSESDRQTIQDEIDQLTTEIDRVSETTKFNEIYLLKGNAQGTKSDMLVNAHDAGLAGKLVDNGKSATFTLDSELNVGDEISIAGATYTIGNDGASTDGEYRKVGDSTYNATKVDVGDSITDDSTGISYTIVDKVANPTTAADLYVSGKTKFMVTHADGTEMTYEVNDTPGAGKISAGDAMDLVKQELEAGSTVTLLADKNGNACNVEVVEKLVTTGSEREISILDSNFATSQTVAELITATGIAAIAGGDSVVVDGEKTTYTDESPVAASDLADIIAAMEKGDTVSVTRMDGTAYGGTVTYTVDNYTDEVNNKYTVADLADMIKSGDKVSFTVAATNVNGTNVVSGKELMDGTGNTLVNGTTYTIVGNVKAEDSDVISKSRALEMIAEELQKASSIGTDTAATVQNNNDGSFVINKGSVEVKDDLNFALHVGADADMTNKIGVNLKSMSSAGLGIKDINVKDDTGASATYAIDAIEDAIKTVSAQRSLLGAVQNRLEHTIKNLDNIVENTTAAESQIRDTDMATEMVKYSNANILSQAGQSMLAQANQSNQGVLSILG